MLKVLYDNGTEDADIMMDHDFSNIDNLFDESDDDDDDEDDADDGSVASIVFDDVDIQSESTLTWALLLRKMKDEMKELGHKQVPTISTSRRFELNDTFSLLPASFDPKKNKKIRDLNPRSTCREKEPTKIEVSVSKDALLKRMNPRRN